MSGQARLLSCVLVLAALSAACARRAAPDPIVGTWLVHDSKAPFPFHMYVFNADGTMQQANPDAGDAHGSDSDGKGVWATDGQQVRGKWVELMADRTSHRFTGRGEYAFEIVVNGDRLTGKGTMHLFAADGRAGDSIPTSFSGERVKAN